MRSRRSLRINCARAMAAIAVVVLLLAMHRASGRHVEALRSPIAVEGWSASGLSLPGRRILGLPGFDALPASSAALAEGTKRGIEIGKDGRVYGLLRVHHWCGNDPIREHIARVDLALLLLYLGEGKSSEPIPPPPWSVTNASSAFSGAGWRVEEFNGFDRWRETRTAHLSLQRTPPPQAVSGMIEVNGRRPVR